MTVVTDQPGSPGPDADQGSVSEDPYAALFRPADEAPPAPEPVAAPASEPAPAQQHSTGRLFRSARAESADGVLPAISSSQAARLRTLVPASAPAVPLPPQVLENESVVVGEDVRVDAVPVISISAQPEAPVGTTARRTSRNVDREEAPRGGRLTGMGVYAVVIGVTLIAGFVNVLLFGPDINAITGVALVVSSVVAALLVRRADDVTAIIAPPLAIGLVAITAAQVGLTTTTLANRFITAFFTLGNNWIWIIGSALAAMVIVAVRRRSR